MTTLNDSITHGVTHAFLTGVLTRLSSVSGSFSEEQISEIISAHITTSGKFAYGANNDLGLCFQRTLEHVELADLTTMEAKEAFITSFLIEDPIVSETITSLVEDIASSISTPLYNLRAELPKKTTALVAAINAKLPADVNADRPTSLRKFDWGKLASSRHRQLAISAVQDKIPGTFKNNEPRYYDATTILNKLRDKQLETVGAVEAVKQILSDTLVAAAKAAVEDVAAQEKLLSYKDLTVDLLTTSRIHNKTLQEVNSDLSERLSSSVVSVTDMIDAVEDLIGFVDVKTITKVNSDTQIATEALLANMEIVSSNIQHIRAAMIFAKESVLKDSVLIAPGIVNGEAFEAFTAEGGSEDMICDYIAYHNLNIGLKIPRHGISGKSIHAINATASKAVAAATESLKSRTTARRAQATMNTVQHHLTVDYDLGMKSGAYTPHMVTNHQMALNKALVSMRSKSLDEIATEYLVAMSNDPLLSTLYKALNANLVNLVKTHDTVTEQDIMQATCESVLVLLTDRLKPFMLPLAA